eukprot:g147.t1
MDSAGAPPAWDSSSLMGKPKAKKWGIRKPKLLGIKSSRSKKLRRLSAEQRSEKYRAILLAYYERYNPEKVKEVDKILAAYAGREEEMLEAMEEKYGKLENEDDEEDDDDEESDDDWKVDEAFIAAQNQSDRGQQRERGSGGSGSGSGSGSGHGGGGGARERKMSRGIGGGVSAARGLGWSHGYNLYVQKNDGGEEGMRVLVLGAHTAEEEGWGGVKAMCATRLYTSEELEGVDVDRIALYLLPHGYNAEACDGKREAVKLLVPNSVWAVELRGRPFVPPLAQHMSPTVAAPLIASGAGAGMGGGGGGGGGSGGEKAAMAAMMMAMAMGGGGAGGGAGMGGGAAGSVGGPRAPAQAWEGVGVGGGSGGGGGGGGRSRKALPRIHVATWVPKLLRPGHQGLRYESYISGDSQLDDAGVSARYETVPQTCQRAMGWLQSYRTRGTPVTLASIQTVTLPCTKAVYELMHYGQGSDGDHSSSSSSSSSSSRGGRGGSGSGSGQSHAAAARHDSTHEQPVDLPPLRGVYSLSTSYQAAAAMGNLAGTGGGGGGGGTPIPNDPYGYGGGGGGGRSKKGGLAAVAGKAGKLVASAAMKSGVAGEVTVRAMVQATRLWFYFDEERTITVTKDEEGVLGLQPVRQEKLGWIVVRAEAGSPCHRAGMPLDDVYLSHVNGECVSPRSCPSFEPRRPGTVSWKQVPYRTIA